MIKLYPSASIDRNGDVTFDGRPYFISDEEYSELKKSQKLGTDIRFLGNKGYVQRLIEQSDGSDKHIFITLNTNTTKPIISSL